MAKRNGFSGLGYAALFFVLFFIIERCVESMFFTLEEQAAHFTFTTFIQVLLACVSWYLGRRIADRKKQK